MHTPFSITVREREFERLIQVGGIIDWCEENRIYSHWERAPNRVRIYFNNERIKTLFLLTYGEYL